MWAVNHAGMIIEKYSKQSTVKECVYFFKKDIELLEFKKNIEIMINLILNFIVDVYIYNLTQEKVT